MSRDAEARGRGLGASRRRVADGRQSHLVAQVRLAQVRQDAADRDAACPNDAQAHEVTHQASRGTFSQVPFFAARNAASMAAWER